MTGVVSKGRHKISAYVNDLFFAGVASVIPSVATKGDLATIGIVGGVTFAFRAVARIGSRGIDSDYTVDRAGEKGTAVGIFAAAVWHFWFK